MNNEIEIEIEIKDTNLIEKTSKSGKSYFKQVGWFHNNKKPYPEEVFLFVKDRSSAYPEGFYHIKASAYVDKYKSLDYFTSLIPIK